jgi:hypothetical protein
MYCVIQDGFYTRVDETGNPTQWCEGDCNKPHPHATWVDAQKCLVKTLRNKADAYRNMARDARNELKAAPVAKRTKR